MGVLGRISTVGRELVVVLSVLREIFIMSDTGNASAQLYCYTYVQNTYIVPAIATIQLRLYKLALM